MPVEPRLRGGATRATGLVAGPIIRGGGGAIMAVRSSSRMTGVAMTGRPAAARNRSARISPALWYRLIGFFASALSTIASTAGETSRLVSLGGRGSSRTCW